MHSNLTLKKKFVNKALQILIDRLNNFISYTNHLSLPKLKLHCFRKNEKEKKEPLQAKRVGFPIGVGFPLRVGFPLLRRKMTSYLKCPRFEIFKPKTIKLKRNLKMWMITISPNFPKQINKSKTDQI